MRYCLSLNGESSDLEVDLHYELALDRVTDERGESDVNPLTFMLTHTLSEDQARLNVLAMGLDLASRSNQKSKELYSVYLTTVLSPILETSANRGLPYVQSCYLVSRSSKHFNR